jgi:ATP-dependent DNA ligase
MEAKSVKEIPRGDGWLYEPKWDGFRCVAFRKGNQVLLQSKAGQPLGRYFPELVEAIAALPQPQFVLDGEIVVESGGGLSFDDLLLRIHPAASRIKKLSKETPASLFVFDLLVDANGAVLTSEDLRARRDRLERFFKLVKSRSVRSSPASEDYGEAQQWMTEMATHGLDGVIAKRLNEPYLSGERTGMVKVKRIRTADCVVGGFRYTQKGDDKIGSLLLGLYNEAGQFDHIGFTSSFTAEQRVALKKVVEPLRGGEGFTGRAPGGPSRWATERSAEWLRLQPKLVVEVAYDHFSGGRFRHGTKFVRWRPDKAPRQCTMDQVQPKRDGKAIGRLFKAA